MSKHTFDPICAACEEKLEQVHPLLIDWFHKVKAVFTESHVSWGHRDQASQQIAFESGKSLLPFPRSRHNALPSQAVDLFQLDMDGIAKFDPLVYRNISEQFPSMTWGGSWVKLRDLDHYEIPQDETKRNQDVPT